VPPVSPGLIALILVAALGLLIAAGVVRLEYQEGIFAVRLRGLSGPLLRFDLRDSWALLGLMLALSWTVATALDRSAWVPGTERLLPLALLAALLGWLMAVSPLSRLSYLIGSALGLLLGLLLFSPLPPLPLAIWPHPELLGSWLARVAEQPHLALLAGLLALQVVTGLWTAWWIFRRRSGLVALLPSGAVMAVEVLNDPSAVLYFFTLVWLACAAMTLLRLNFVGLKQRWRNLHVPRAADTGWSFGEVGFEATALLLVAAFVLPPLNTHDLSNFLLPGSFNPGKVNPFSGFGVVRLPGPAEVGYSETVRPGTSLKAKPRTIMVVSGDTPTFYPYFRGIVLGGWDGISWYGLPSTAEHPILVQPRLASRTSIARDDLPANPQLMQYTLSSYRIVVPSQEINATVFSAGETIWVDGHSTRVRGQASATPGSGSRFMTVDHVQVADGPKTPYQFSVYEATPNVDARTLRSTSNDYPQWLSPYRSLYDNGRIASGYTTQRDADIENLAASIVAGAHAQNPYDQAKAIEAYFRGGQFAYTLTPPAAPAGVRPLDYFLFDSRRGYCEDFSTAMAVMLRTLHIPVRQVSGFGTGNYDERTHRYLVGATDAHTWVEVYFNGFGWIPFEPTPDGANFPINRPATPAELQAATPGTVKASSRPPSQQLAEPGLPAGVSGDQGNVMDQIAADVRWTILAVLLLLLVAFLAGMQWLLGVHDLPRIWRRLLFVGDQLGIARHQGDTPAEYGMRFGRNVPELESEVNQLARLYTRSRFRRGGLSRAEQMAAQESWHKLRRRFPGLLRRSLRRTTGISEEEAATTENRRPAGRR
jgi:transglutaminase-like putative cysteine protease